MHFGDITTFLLHPLLLFFFFFISRNVAGAFEVHSFCLKLDHLMWPLLYVIIKTWFLCSALYLVAQEMCPALGKNGVAYLTYPVSREDVRKRALFLRTVQKVLLYLSFFIFLLLLAQDLNLKKNLWKTFLLDLGLFAGNSKKRLHYYKKMPL